MFQDPKTYAAKLADYAGDDPINRAEAIAEAMRSYRGPAAFWRDVMVALLVNPEA